MRPSSNLIRIGMLLVPVMADQLLGKLLERGVVDRRTDSIKPAPDVVMTRGWFNKDNYNREKNHSQ